MNVGKQISALRKKHNITQEALAGEMGVTGGAVSKWETGVSHS
ncbi:MAG: helix-turn-helix domain-containing protein [Lachnospiraceae bacterium]|nr:helix-turn-helix domain-containing protein [Lachnospiraceae bacterium]